MDNEMFYCNVPGGIFEKIHTCMGTQGPSEAYDSQKQFKLMGLCSTWKKDVKIRKTDKGRRRNDQKVTYRLFVLLHYCYTHVCQPRPTDSCFEENET